jgi:hypothetical protein
VIIQHFNHEILKRTLSRYRSVDFVQLTRYGTTHPSVNYTTKHARDCAEEMSRKLLLTQKQITAICKGASRAGHVAIIEVEGVSIRLLPSQIASGINEAITKHVDKDVIIRF